MNDWTVLQMSLSASVLIFVIAVIRLFGINKLPKTTFRVFWGVALCRLLVPFSVPSPLSVYNAVDGVSGRFWPEARRATQPVEPIVNSSARMTASGSVQREAMMQATDSLTSIVPLAIWLTGAAVLAAYFVVTHWRGLKEYRTALPIHDRFLQQWLAEHPLRRTIRIRQSDKIASPLTYGIWRPVILLPKSLDYTDHARLRLILTHEMIHIKRFDTLAKWLLAAALCVHWFNPLVWVMYILASRDIELSCDEAVVRTFGEHAKSAYALTLIGMAEAGSGWAISHNHFSKNPVEERIVAIMKFKRANFWGVVLSFALVGLTSAAFATSATETNSLGLFESAFAEDEDASRYAGHINEATEETASVTEPDYGISIRSTLFTDRRAYAIIGLKGNVPEHFGVSGRIVYADSDQTVYELAGNIREVGSEDGVRHFLYSADIAPVGTGRDAQAAVAAGDHFLKFNSLWDHEGTRLELTVRLAGREHVLATTVTNVFTEAIVIRPDAAHYDGDYYDTIALKPALLKMSGMSEKTHEMGWVGPHFNITIVLAGGKQIHIGYDTRGLVYDEGYPIAGSQGYNDRTGEFYAMLDFRGWELNLKRVKAIIVDGVIYRVSG